MPKTCNVLSLLTLFIDSLRFDFIMSHWVNSEYLLSRVHQVPIKILSAANVNVSQRLCVMVVHSQSCPYVVEVHW